MLDLNLIREQPDLVRTALRNRQMEDALVDSILRLDENRRKLLTEVEQLKAQRNSASKEVGQLKDTAARQSRIDAMRLVGDQIAILDKQVADVDAQLADLTATIPNLPDPRTPLGKGDDDDVLVSTVGEPKSFDFHAKPHWDLGPALGIIDFERGTKITGSRFYVLQRRGRPPRAGLDRVHARPAHSPGIHREIPAFHGQDRDGVRRRSTPQICRQPVQGP